MRLPYQLQQLAHHKETIFRLIVLILLFGSGVFFLTDIWSGNIAKSTICPTTERCSLAESATYAQTLSGSGIELTESYLNDRVASELGSLMEIVQQDPHLHNEAQEMNAALTLVRSQITSAVAANERIYTLLQDRYATLNDLRYITHTIRLALISYMEQYLINTTQTEVSTLAERLDKVVPRDLSIFSISQLFQERSVDYMKPGDLFVVENVQITGTKTDGNIFDTVSVKMTVQGTLGSLTAYLKDIGSSGDISRPPTNQSLPLARLVRLSLTTLGTTNTASSIDLPRTIYRGDVELEMYTKTVTRESLAALENEVAKLRETAKSKQATALLSQGAEGQKTAQLFDLAHNAERSLESAFAKNELRQAETHLKTLRELYQTILSQFLAS